MVLQSPLDNHHQGPGSAISLDMSSVPPFWLTDGDGGKGGVWERRTCLPIVSPHIFNERRLCVKHLGMQQHFLHSRSLYPRELMPNKLKQIR